MSDKNWNFIVDMQIFVLADDGVTYGGGVANA